MKSYGVYWHKVIWWRAQHWPGVCSWKIICHRTRYWRCPSLRLNDLLFGLFYNFTSYVYFFSFFSFFLILIFYKIILKIIFLWTNELYLINFNNLTCKYVSKFPLNKLHVNGYGIYCSMLNWCHLITDIDYTIIY